MKLSRLSAACCLSITLLSPALFAQEVDDGVLINNDEASLAELSGMDANNSVDLEDDSNSPAKEVIRVSGSRLAKNRASSQADIEVNQLDYQGLSLTEIFNQQEGLGYVGQGGMFQVVSVRGLSGWRVRSMLADIPIMTERRAGSSLSFIDPLFLDKVEIVKGSSSTQYGSGAIGGTVQLFPADFDGSRLTFNLDLNDLGQRVFAASGNGDSSLALSLHNQENVSDAKQQELFTGYEQASAMFHHHWQLEGDRDVSIFLLPSYSRDMGKSSVDFPDSRITTYLSEEHWLGYINVNDLDYGYLTLYFHDQTLVTEANRVAKRVNTVENASSAYGLYWRNEQYLNAGLDVDFQVTYGLDVFHRADVQADEVERADGSINFSDTVLSGDETDSAAFLEFALPLDDNRYSAGARWSRLSQSSSVDSKAASRLTGFARIDRQLSSHFTTAFGYSQGFRFPSITERFFDGTTGRGTLKGEPNLLAETSDNWEWNLAYQKDNISGSFSLHYQEIDNFIERIPVGEGVNSFANRQGVSIQGAEFATTWGLSSLQSGLALKVHGQWLRGRDENELPINDVPNHRLGLTLSDKASDRPWVISAIYNLAKNDAGSGELARNSSLIIDASYQVPLMESNLTFKINNLLDDEYFLSADEKATLARERSFNLVWSKTF